MDGMTNTKNPTPDTYEDSGMTNTEVPTPDTYEDSGVENTDIPTPDTYEEGDEATDSTVLGAEDEGAPKEEGTDISVEEKEEQEGIHTETGEAEPWTPGAGNFVANLPYMGKGMLAIFVVIAVIIGVTALLNKVFKK